MEIADAQEFLKHNHHGVLVAHKRDGSLHEPGFIRKGRTALATLRWDGYVSLDAGREAARMVLKPLRFAGRQLTVNLAAGRGSLRAELRDDSGAAIPGWTFADCQPTRGDGLALSVRWRDRESLAPLNGKTVRIAFELTDASLYGFQFAG